MNGLSRLRLEHKAIEHPQEIEQHRLIAKYIQKNCTKEKYPELSKIKPHMYQKRLKNI
jgi:hypothetical protein